MDKYKYNYTFQYVQIARELEEGKTPETLNKILQENSNINLKQEQ